MGWLLSLQAAWLHSRLSGTCKAWSWEAQAAAWMRVTTIMGRCRAAGLSSTITMDQWKGGKHLVAVRLTSNLLPWPPEAAMQ